MSDRISQAIDRSLPVSQARYVDASRAEMLERLGIHTIGELLRHYPHRWLDLTHTATTAAAALGEEQTIVGWVHEVQVREPKPRFKVTELTLRDDTGVVIASWFNSPWIARMYRAGERLAISGKVEFDFGAKRMKAPFVERLSDDASDEWGGRVLPVHPLTDGLAAGWLRRLVAAAIEDHGDIPDHLPAQLRINRELVSLRCAIRDIHFPPDMHAAAAARRRLAYDELLSLQLYMAMRRHGITRDHAGVAHVVDGHALHSLMKSLPFTLTEDQRRSVDEILSDMASPHPMNRLLLGDVGTGKTAVAAHALVAVADTGSQAAMMAPTEVLAMQYAEKVGPLLDACGVSWGLLTGSTPTAPKRELLTAVAGGDITVLFGTHALLEEHVSFQRLSLAIVDEQHRFGVNQRLGLRGKGASADLLVMTATPIPRSLALTLYGDLATSYIRQRPSTAAGVTTKHVKPHQAQPAHDAVRAAVAEGHQAYVVCALVDESDSSEAKAATREAERLRNQVFPDLRVGLLTGRMKPSEKAETMRAFREREVDVLVSTTVIEVGVDVPNATVMIVEDAHKFGLAQLHQLRGRVGRGTSLGQVWLISEAQSKEAKSRIQALLDSSDGFELAERDLKLRGEGSILGDRQHGMPELRVANLIDDLDLVELARLDAFDLVAADPHLTHVTHAPLLAEVKRAFSEAWEWVSSG